MRRKVLILAHDFPPKAGSGVARPFSFAKYLPEHGFDTIVLTRQHNERSVSGGCRLYETPNSVLVHRVAPGDWSAYVEKRVFWLRPLTHLVRRDPTWLKEGLEWRIRHWNRRRYLDVRWTYPAIREGIRLVELYRPDIVLATGPPFRTLRAAGSISRQTNLPLVVDMRDPWTYGPLWDSTSWRIARGDRACERRILKHAARVVFTSPLTERRMAEQYPRYTWKFVTIPNGFEGGSESSRPAARDGKMMLSYTGTLRNTYRRPGAFLDALQLVCNDHPEIAAQLEVRFVGDCGGLSSEVASRNLSNVVRIAGHVSYSECRALMRASDALLLLQTIEGAGSDVISGKLYEYLAARKPILAVVSPDGGDAWLLREAGMPDVAGTTDPQRIAEAIRKLWATWRDGSLQQATTDEQWLARFDRRTLAGKVAKLMDAVLAAPPAPAYAAAQ